MKLHNCDMFTTVKDGFDYQIVEQIYVMLRGLSH